jgi:manganese-transporting P-type ATPase
LFDFKNKLKKMSSAWKKIDDGSVYQVRMLRSIPWFQRWDTAPFTILYIVMFFIIFTADIFESKYSTLSPSLARASPGSTLLEGKTLMNGNNNLNNPLVRCVLVGIPVLLMSQVILFLLSQWSTTLKSNIGYQSVTTVIMATHLHVVASKNAGNDRIVAVERISDEAKEGQPLSMVSKAEKKVEIAGSKYFLLSTRFKFQQMIYEYNTDKNTFERLNYPVVGAIKSYIAHKGHSEQPSVEIAFRKWGANIFAIPVPAFLDLYVENLTSPFFIFQCLCLFLWSLDDYWYYSAFTLLMLMFFEGMLCKQRQAGVRRLRTMQRPPTTIQVYRNNTWVLTSTELLIPGDVISLSANFFKQIQAQEAEKHGKYGEVADSGEDCGHAEGLTIPVDAMIIRGSCVVNEAMLTGESIPQMKETLRNFEDIEEVIDMQDGQQSDITWKRHMIFSGTSLIQDSNGHEEKLNIPVAPQSGCTAVVVRTGFGTTQGGLMRKILFASERINATSFETVKFIAVLVVFATVASAVVLKEGLQDESRNTFKLILHCIMIITSVIPPELPMELSLAVTNSLNELSKSLVYCTEPFRIPYAGKLDVLCFDKTGTLTTDRMQLRGVAGQCDISLFESGAASAAVSGELNMTSTLNEDYSGNTPLCVLSVMASCNSLLQSGSSDVQGDPLEIVTFKASGFLPKDNAKHMVGLNELVHAKKAISITRCAHYPFTSALKRMSIIALIDGQEGAAGSKTKPNLWVFTKGAPEILATMLSSVPSNYQKMYRQYMNKGKRVLALAGKRLSVRPDTLRDYPRASAEKQLEFFGFLIYDCDLKADSKSVIRELNQSNHKVMMITGDSPHTAADVGRRLTFLNKSKKLQILQKLQNGNLVWRLSDLDDGEERMEGDIDFKESTLSTLAISHDLCMTGESFSEIGRDLAEGAVARRNICKYVNIFARVSPSQKEEILIALNDTGMYTLMCGDGTNDVGALKAAHVGVSIVNNPDFEMSIEATAKKALGSSTSGYGDKKVKGASARDRMARALAESQKQEADPTLVKLGDASIASPFTARRTSIDSVLSVMRQGRCTLVTTIQVFKLLALNCLVSAYMMTFLYLRGLKQGDIQMTANGLVTAALFFFLSLAKPLNRLASTKPPSSVFSLSASLSILGQFVIHLICLIYTLQLCDPYVLPDDVTMSADGKFYPNIVNSAVFLLSAVMQVNNFVVNYRGHPYTQSITENRYLWRSVQVIYIVLLVIAGGQVEPLNDLLQMAPFPNAQFQTTLLGVLIFNFGASFGIERLCQKLE